MNQVEILHNRVEFYYKKETDLAQQMDDCMEQFKALSADEQKKIRDEIKQPFYKILPSEKVRIFTYMNFNKQRSL